LLVVEVAESEGRGEVLERVEVEGQNLEKIVAYYASIARVLAKNLRPEEFD
jgi:hypothetical protein